MLPAAEEKQRRAEALDLTRWLRDETISHSQGRTTKQAGRPFLT